MRKTRLTAVLPFTLALVLLAPACGASEAYFSVPLSEVKLTSGTLPGVPPVNNGSTIRLWLQGRPYAVLEGAGDAYVSPLAVGPADATKGAGLVGRLYVHTPALRDVTGSLYLPNPDGRGMVPLKFKVPAAAATADAEQAFYAAKEAHYERLMSRQVPGGAWFRHQAREARKARGHGAGFADQGPRPNRPSGLEDTYALFSGGRALSENLQLDRALPTADAPAGGGVKLDTIKGITVQPMDWKSKVAGLKVDPDPLAKLIPADQHALFFRTFTAMAALAEEAERHGAPILQAIEPRSEDARTRQRYETQLCLSLTGLGRLVGPRVINSVAVTGSDPYLRVGSDFAILFEARDVAVLEKLILTQVSLVAGANRQVSIGKGDGPLISYTSAVTPDRSVSVYVARLGDAVVVTNSPAQLTRLAEVHRGKAPSLASLDEYAFFRDRYKRADADESAFLLLTDATIRRWCGPRWRIADSRRTRAAAILSELQAVHLAQLAAGKVEPGPVQTDLPGAADLGELRLTPAGVTSSVYGSLTFMTPISELKIETVTPAEEAAYKLWRDTYQENWRQYFDPIAIRLTVKDDAVAADMTVMPLIKYTDYRPLISATSGAAIAPGAADPHDALAHLVVAVSTKSPTVQLGAAFLANVLPGDKSDLLASVGQSVALYADPGPFWDELARAKDPEAFLRNNLARMPIGLHVELKDAARMRNFLAGAREWVGESRPGMTNWQDLAHEGQPFTKVTATEKGVAENRMAEGVALYYAATDAALVVSMDEGVITRALDRQAARNLAQPAEPPAGAAPAGDAAALVAPVDWLGSSAAMRVAPRVWSLIDRGMRGVGGDPLRERSWANLPILNEWKRLYPEQDPVELHERLWQTRLLDPAGGQYLWNEKYQTMESTTYGHPGEPQAAPGGAEIVRALRGASFGLTFEDNGTGLRARGVLQRKAGPGAERRE